MSKRNLIVIVITAALVWACFRICELEREVQLWQETARLLAIQK